MLPRQGEYGAKLNVAFGQYVDFSVAVTLKGIQVIADGLVEHCHYVVDPETKELFIHKAKGNKCDVGNFEIVNTDRDLTFKFSSWNEPVSVPLLSGNMGDEWIANTPDVATMRGVSIGDAMPSDDSGISGYDRVEYRGRLVEYQQSSLGFSGYRSTNYFGSSSYHHAYSPETSTDGSYSISFDDMGIYSIDGKVFATMRHFEPPEQKSPRFDAVIDALQTNYGVPTVSKRSGVSHIYEWHFRPNGSLIDETNRSACDTRFRGDDTTSRDILMSRDELRTSWVEFHAGIPPEIVTINEGKQLRAFSECGYTVYYNIRPTESGLLDILSSFMFAHDPVRAEIWRSRGKVLSRKIQNNLDLQRQSRELKPEL